MSKLLDRLLSSALTRSDSVDNIVDLLHEIIPRWRDSLTSIYMEGVDGAPDWLEFESRTWELGEAIRRALAKKSAWKKSLRLRQCFEAIVRDRKLEKGRQPFVELVARFPTDLSSEIIIDLLHDPDLYGHAVNALLIAKIPGAADRVTKILKDERHGWIRRKARKYLELASE